MSRTAEIVLIVCPEDHDTAKALSHWMDTPEAFDPGVTLFREVDAMLKGKLEELDVKAPLGTVGRLRPLNTKSGLKVWGGFKAPSVSIWGTIANNMSWSRFLDQVAAMPWTLPDKVQLLLKDEGDPFFRVYMFRDGELRNVIPGPDDQELERAW